MPENVLFAEEKHDDKGMERLRGQISLDWVEELFRAIDRMDSEGFVSYLTDDSVFQFGNMPPVNGKKNIHDAVAGFLASIKGISHKLTGTWKVDDMVFVRGESTYTRKNGTTLTVPFFDTFKMRGSLVSEYVIYIDLSRLYT